MTNNSKRLVEYFFRGNTTAFKYLLKIQDGGNKLKLFNNLLEIKA